MSKKIPSPCISVCKFKRDGHCIGCSMTKTQKSLYKKIKKPKHQYAFIELLRNQQVVMGKYSHWLVTYARKCAKKGIKNPVETLNIV